MKLLFSEYCDFEDMVLIESPFAQTTKDGNGLRQVHLGLTPSKLVLATDVLPPVEKSTIEFYPGIDPDIETFELIAIYPIDCVNLSVYRRYKRQTIKAHFCNNKIFYFELGGFENRTMFWNLWCEKVKFLAPESGTSHSETSVATSSSNSTLYLVDSRQVVKPNGLTQVWCKFGTGNQMEPPKWTDRHLFLSKTFQDYKPMMNPPSISQFVKKPTKLSHFSVTAKNQSSFNEVHIGDSYHIPRFGSGIKENCNSGLFLPAENYIVPRRFSQTSGQSSGSNFGLSCCGSNSFDIIAEDCVRLWELHHEANVRRRALRHRRRYGIAPQPLFLYGLGPWNINPGAKYSIQVKRAVSVVTIRRQPLEPELRLPVTKRQLVATISCETLLHNKVKKNQVACGGPRRPVIFFWTPDYWYRPRSAKDAYQELQNHLTKIKDFQQKHKKKRRLFRRWAQRPDSSSSDSSETELRQKKRRSTMKFSMFGRSNDMCDVALCCLISPTDEDKYFRETSLQYLKRLLKIDTVLTAWDFNSSVLAQQLTMIDRDLFLKVSPIELSVLVNQQSSKNAPNVAAMVAFSHRISCLVTSDILKCPCERTRARLISRFIGVAERCHRISNFQSCRTVLLGLQSPAIYRLKVTWAYVRKKHASKYQTFEFLCRLYRDPRLFFYQRTFYLSTQTTHPYLPFIGDLIAKLLDRVPEYKLKDNVKVLKDLHKGSNLLGKLLTSMRMVNFQDSEEASNVLCQYYKPLNCYEDNRVKCLSETTDFLQKCQLSALNYNYGPNKLAIDYLLKARYKEERENFFYSFRIEPIDA